MTPSFGHSIQLQNIYFLRAEKRTWPDGKTITHSREAKELKPNSTLTNETIENNTAPEERQPQRNSKQNSAWNRAGAKRTLSPTETPPSQTRPRTVLPKSHNHQDTKTKTPTHMQTSRRGPPATFTAMYNIYTMYTHQNQTKTNFPTRSNEPCYAFSKAKVIFLSSC
ncbi:hypothetical protein HOLleu_07230 [Holothuria leucospilota]|uniref:Uncharacterized protein n=1 Tax=Holothuria leucospilota TaxID=206669 RepID=A0A9Q1CGF3_HOLLE|nr:hypothetical protein HOLleu_07230 [Holothuria leucospilota]